MKVDLSGNMWSVVAPELAMVKQQLYLRRIEAADICLTMEQRFLESTMHRKEETKGE